MKKKILGICICTVLIATTVLPVAGELDEKNNTSTGGIEDVPVIDFIDPPMFNLRTIPLTLVNYGAGTADDMTWQMEILEGGGLFQGELFFPKEDSGIIGSMGPGSDYGEKVKLSGIGITTIRFNCIYTMSDLCGCDVEFEVKQEWVDIGLFSLHLILPGFQPDKEWVDIENYSYYNETDGAAGIEFYVEGIRQMHNVRVVLGLGSKNDDVEFLAACKFYDGVAVLEECWITRDIVEGGDAHWELETLDNE